MFQIKDSRIGGLWRTAVNNFRNRAKYSTSVMDLKFRVGCKWCEHLFLLFQDVMLGASAINCWWPARNMLAWYSLRLSYSSSVISLTGSKSHEESRLPKQSMPIISKCRRRKHHATWLLPDRVWKASSIPVSHLWKDILFEFRHSLPSTPTPPLNFR